MADPTEYEVSYSFSGFQATDPSSPLPAPRIDVEFAAIETSLNEAIAAIKDIRRSDGVLQNEIVTLSSLEPGLLDRFAGSSAYTVAVDNGFVGTEAEWLATLEGNPATIAVGTVTTLAPGSDATVQNVGTGAAAVFDIGIPRGNPGADGDGSGDMTAATYDPRLIVADVYDVDNHTDGTTNKVYTATEKTKLAGVASGATANSADATLLARANHTGTQAISTVTGLQTALDAKVATSAIGSTVQAYDADTLKSDTDANLTAGFTSTAVNDGTKSTGTYTPSPSGGNLRRAVNGGAHTLAAPSASNDYTMVIQYTNNGSAGAITLSGFSKTSGDSFTTTNGHDFFVYITKINGFTHANVVALQ